MKTRFCILVLSILIANFAMANLKSPKDGVINFFDGTSGKVSFKNAFDLGRFVRPIPNCEGKLVPTMSRPNTINYGYWGDVLVEIDGIEYWVSEKSFQATKPVGSNEWIYTYFFTSIEFNSQENCLSAQTSPENIKTISFNLYRIIDGEWHSPSEAGWGYYVTWDLEKGDLTFSHNIYDPVKQVRFKVDVGNGKINSFH